MYIVTVKMDFNAAHRLREYKGKCESLHGHNWTVEVSVKNDCLKNNGMVIDFTCLKKDLEKTLEVLDHKFLNEIIPFKENNPTSENIAKYIYDKLKAIYDNLNKVTVFETPTSSASYEQCSEE